MFLKKKNHLAKIYKFKCFKLEYNNIAAKYSELCHEKPFTIVIICHWLLKGVRIQKSGRHMPQLRLSTSTFSAFETTFF